MFEVTKIVQFCAGLWLSLQNITVHCLLPSPIFSTTFLPLPSGKLTLIESPQTIKDPGKSRQTGIGRIFTKDLQKNLINLCKGKFRQIGIDSISTLSSFRHKPVSIAAYSMGPFGGIRAAQLARYGLSLLEFLLFHIHFVRPIKNLDRPIDQ